MGTRFMASRECPLHPVIKELLRQTGEGDTVMVQRSINNAGRVIRSAFSERIREMEAKGAKLEELLPLLDGNRIKKSYQSGDAGDAIIYCGQGVGLIDDIPSVKEIIDGIMRQAGQVMARLQGLDIS